MTAAENHQLRRVREAYLDRAQRSAERFFIVDASREPHSITEALLTEAQSWI